MATQIMLDAGRDKLQAFPEISREELVRYFTLTPADEGFLAAHRRPANRLGLAVQLCTLPRLGFVPDNVASAPAPAVARLAEHLGVTAEVLSSYGARDQTRTDHLGEVAKFLRWRQAGAVVRKELSQFLVARAMEHDSPRVLFRLASEYLRTSRVVRPGPDWLARQVAAARELARSETYQRIEPVLAAKARPGRGARHPPRCRHRSWLHPPSLADHGGQPGHARRSQGRAGQARLPPRHRRRRAGPGCPAVRTQALPGRHREAVHGPSPGPQRP
jgi:hypothetical protein